MKAQARAGWGEARFRRSAFRQAGAPRQIPLVGIYCGMDAVTTATSATRRARADGALEFTVTGMTCAACAARIERVVDRLPGVRAHVNLATGTASVERDAGAPDAAEIAAVIERAGYGARLRTDPVADHARDTADRIAARASLQRDFVVAAVLSLPLFATMLPMLAGRAMHGEPAFACVAAAAGDAGAILGRAALLRRRMACAARRRRQHGRAGGAGDQHRVRIQRRRGAGGSRAARLFRGRGRGDHAGAAGQADRSAVDGAHVCGTGGADPAVAQDRARPARRRAARRRDRRRRRRRRVRRARRRSGRSRRRRLRGRSRRSTKAC